MKNDAVKISIESGEGIGFACRIYDKYYIS